MKPIQKYGILLSLYLAQSIPMSFFSTVLPVIMRMEEYSLSRIAFSNILGFFHQKRIGRRVVLLVIFYAGIIGILSMLKPYLVDMGYTLKEIAFMTGIFGTAFGAGSAFLGGYILKRVGNMNGLRLFAFYGCVAAGFMTFIAFGNTSIVLVYTGIALTWSAYGMASVAIFTISMNTVRKGKEGTDYTIQIVLTHLSSLLVVVISGGIGDWIGYSGLFLVETIIGFIVTLSIGKLYFDPEISPEPAYLLSEEIV